MIQANELRIGNYVVKSEQVTSNSPEYGQITTVYIDKAVVDYHYPLTWYKPISLTEEWLMKFGFEKSEFCSAFINNSDFCIRLKNGEYHFQNDSDSDAGCHFLCKVKHVHQLQNLYFALTGEELTVKE